MQSRDSVKSDLKRIPLQLYQKYLVIYYKIFLISEEWALGLKASVDDQQDVVI